MCVCVQVRWEHPLPGILPMSTTPRLVVPQLELTAITTSSTHRVQTSNTNIPESASPLYEANTQAVAERIEPPSFQQPQQHSHVAASVPVTQASFAVNTVDDALEILPLPVARTSPAASGVDASALTAARMSPAASGVDASTLTAARTSPAASGVVPAVPSTPRELPPRSARSSSVASHAAAEGVAAVASRTSPSLQQSVVGGAPANVVSVPTDGTSTHAP